MSKPDAAVKSSNGGFAESHDSPVVKTLHVDKRDVATDSAQGSGVDAPSVATPGGAYITSENAARSLYIPPVPHAWTPPPPDGWIYWLSWGTIYAGDCRMEGAIVHVYPDGMIYFQAATISSSSGDVWIIRGIQFHDGYSNPIGWSIPRHDGMAMAWEGSEYPFSFWDQIPAAAPSAVAQIRKATMTSHC